MRYLRKQHLLIVLLHFGCILNLDTKAWSQQVEQTQTLEVIGTGKIYRDNVAKARDQAIEHGLWNALEQGVGVLISSATVVGHFQLLSDRVYSQTETFIHDYKVLMESKSGRFYRVVIRVTLLMSALQNKLQDIGILMADKELPSVLFLLSEQNVGEVSPRYSWGQSPFARLPLAIEDTVSGYMREKGFVVLGSGTFLDQGGGFEPEYAGSELSDEAAVRLAEQVHADVVIMGEAFASFSGNVLGTDMKSVEAVLSVRAIRTENRLVIGSSDVTGAAVHANEMVAGIEAITLAASDVAQDITRQIAANWAREKSQSVLVELVVKGIKEYADFVRFRMTLKNEIPGVKNVYLRAIEAGEAKMDIDVTVNTSTLVEELMLKSFEGFGVNIFEVGQSWIKLELMPKHDVLDASERPGEVRSEAW
jgi:hypothetical protein